MAHFAKLDANNKVVDVIVVHNNVINDLPFPESEPLGIEFCKSLYGEDTVWKQTSYNKNFRAYFASIENEYNEELDVFIPPNPFPSWSFNTQTLKWEAPTPKPENDIENNIFYVWNENTLSWELD